MRGPSHIQLTCCVEHGDSRDVLCCSIDIYDTLHPHKPLKALAGDAPSSFHGVWLLFLEISSTLLLAIRALACVCAAVKLAFSPDAEYLLGGSCSKSAYIWQVRACRHRGGHCVEWFVIKHTVVAPCV